MTSQTFVAEVIIAQEYLFNVTDKQRTNVIIIIVLLSTWKVF